MEVAGEEKTEIEELLAITYLNMAICFFLTNQYQKSVEKATLSI